MSNYNADLSPWNGVCYEFLSTIAEIETADVFAPPAAAGDEKPVPKYRTAAAELARVFSSHRTPRMQRMDAKKDYELGFFMCQFTRDIAAVERIRHWRERTQHAVAFVLESWSGELSRYRATLRLLDKFDHVFVLNASAVAELRRYTSTPVSYLPTATDCIAACPYPRSPARVVDVLSLGRRLPFVHEALLELAHETGLFYQFDLWRNLKAWDWGEIRAANADLIKRSRYFIAWDPSRFNSSKTSVIRDDRVISTRYFEAAAGGAIILGSHPDCPEFDQLFDWPDAVVEISVYGEDVRQRIAELDADVDRCATVRTHNIVNSLRRHDWAYRWETVLDRFGLAPTSQHEARKAELERRARAIEAAADARGRYTIVGA
jgi:Glycosyl transferases group 1